MWIRRSALMSHRKAAARPQAHPGEGASTAPSWSFVLRDAIGRDWQCGTLQVDFWCGRLECGLCRRRRRAQDARHAAPRHLGSFERMIGVLIEHLPAAFPLWLARRKP